MIFSWFRKKALNFKNITEIPDVDKECTLEKER